MAAFETIASSIACKFDFVPSEELSEDGTLDGEGGRGSIPSVADASAALESTLRCGVSYGRFRKTVVRTDKEVVHGEDAITRS
jgi:hypothetical protein